MDTPLRTETAVWADEMRPISWASVAAGAIVAAALSLGLLALGAGLGLSSISPWGNSGVSAATFRNGSGIYLVIVAVMASAIGGYLAARLRSTWTRVHTNEVFFRDTAHGLIAWAFATVLSASVLGAAATHVVAGATAGGLASATPQTVSQVYVDRLLRPDGAAPATTPADDTTRAELTRLWTSTVAANGDLAAVDRAYIARLVSARTGLSQADAEKRVNDVVGEAKAALDQARNGAAKLAFWMTAALFFGAFAASLAAVEGGQLRDGTWNDRRIVPRPW